VPGIGSRFEDYAISNRQPGHRAYRRCGRLPGAGSEAVWKLEPGFRASHTTP